MDTIAHSLGFKSREFKTGRGLIGKKADSQKTDNAKVGSPKIAKPVVEEKTSTTKIPGVVKVVDAKGNPELNKASDSTEIKKFSARNSGVNEAKSSGNKFDYDNSNDDSDANNGNVGDDDKNDDIQNSIKTNSKEQEENKGWLTKTRLSYFQKNSAKGLHYKALRIHN